MVAAAMSRGRKIMIPNHAAPTSGAGDGACHRVRPSGAGAGAGRPGAGAGRLAAELGRLRTQAADLRRAFDADRTRVRFAQDASGPVSQVFLRHRDALPAIRDERRQLAEVRASAARCELERLDASEAQDGPLEEVLARNAALHADLEAALVDLDEVTESYRAFLDAQLFWIPDMPSFGGRDLGEAAGFLRTAVSTESLRSAAADLRYSLAARPAGDGPPAALAAPLPHLL
ncbi:MAG: hypothetical protein ACO3YN_12085 [Rubrivivax sp.]